MKRHQEVDEFFRGKLEHHESNAPMHLWSRIEQKMDEKQEEKPLISPFALQMLFWIFLVGIFVTSVLSNRDSGPTEPLELGCFPTENYAIASSTDVDQANETDLLDANNTTNTRSAINTATPSRQLPFTAPAEAIAQSESQMALEQELAAGEQATRLDEPREAEAPANDFVENSLLHDVALLPSLDLLDKSGNRFLALPQDIRCARFGGSNWHFYTELLGGIELPLREFQPRNAEADAYARLREKTEFPSSAFSSSLRFSAISDQGIALRTGLQYAQINERFSYYNENEQRTIITDIYDSAGHLIRTDTVWVAGAEYKADNRYKMINVPLILGYERDFGRLTFAMNAGISLNLWMDASGQYLSPNDLQQPVSFGSASSATEKNTYQTNIGLGWYGSLGIIYEIKHRWQLMAEPAFRIHPKSLTRGNYPLDQRYFVAGLNLGIRRAL